MYKLFPLHWISHTVVNPIYNVLAPSHVRYLNHQQYVWCWMNLFWVQVQSCFEKYPGGGFDPLIKYSSHHWITSPRFGAKQIIHPSLTIYKCTGTSTNCNGTGLGILSSQLLQSIAERCPANSHRHTSTPPFGPQNLLVCLDGASLPNAWTLSSSISSSGWRGCSWTSHPGPAHPTCLSSWGLVFVWYVFGIQMYAKGNIWSQTPREGNKIWCQSYGTGPFVTSKGKQDKNTCNTK